MNAMILRFGVVLLAPTLIIGCASSEDATSDADSEVVSSGKIVSLTDEGDSFCALREDGRLLCWNGSLRGGAAGDFAVRNVKGAADIAQVSPVWGGTKLWTSWAVRRDGKLTQIVEGERASDSNPANAMDDVRMVDRQTLVTKDGRLFDYEYLDAPGKWVERSDITGVVEYVEGTRLRCAVNGARNVTCAAGPDARSLDVLQALPAKDRDVDSLPWTRMDFLGKARKLAVGHDLVCALRENGHVLCVGKPTATGTGEGAAAADPTNTTALREVRGVDDAVDISVSRTSTTACAVRATGGVVCWGKNLFPDAADKDVLTPRAVPSLDDAARVFVVGDRTACAIDTKGKPSCWGYVGNGVLASNSKQPRQWGTDTYSDTPLPIGGL